jgi:hypothetical protein
MAILSPPVAASTWEIWLFGRPDLRMHVSECGSFRSEGQCVRVAGLVRCWLQLGVFGPELRAVLPDENDRASLSALPDVLLSLGYDPALVMVSATRANDPLTRSASGSWREDGAADVPGPHLVAILAERR